MLDELSATVPLCLALDRSACGPEMCGDGGVDASSVPRFPGAAQHSALPLGWDRRFRHIARESLRDAGHSSCGDARSFPHSDSNPILPHSFKFGGGCGRLWAEADQKGSNSAQHGQTLSRDRHGFYAFGQICLALSTAVRPTRAPTWNTISNKSGPVSPTRRRNDGHPGI